MMTKPGIEASYRRAGGQPLPGKSKIRRKKMTGYDAISFDGTEGISTLFSATLYANAKFYAEPKVLDKPIIKVSLSDQTHDNNTHQPFNKNLTEKEFLALWDALLNGIKPRPKGLWGADSIKK